MPVTTPGEAVPAFALEPHAQAAYERFAEAHHGELDPTLLLQAMFNAGVYEGVRLSAAFSDITGALRYIREDLRRVDRRAEELQGLLEGIAEATA